MKQHFFIVLFATLFILTLVLVNSNAPIKLNANFNQ